MGKVFLTERITERKGGEELCNGEGDKFELYQHGGPRTGYGGGDDILCVKKKVPLVESNHFLKEGDFTKGTRHHQCLTTTKGEPFCHFGERRGKRGRLFPGEKKEGTNKEKRRIVYLATASGGR